VSAAQTIPASGAVRDRDVQLEKSQSEVAALRAELRAKDKLLGALLTHPQDSRQPNAADSKENPTERAINLLDERLFAGVLSGREVRDLEAAVRTSTRDLPSTVKSTVTCSTELCRVTLDGTESDLARHSGEVLEHLPKTFAGGLVLSDGPGRRAVFAAMRRELLATAEPPNSSDK